MSLLHLDYDDISEKVLIGQGGYGKIFKSKFNLDFVALKVMEDWVFDGTIHRR